MHRKSMQPFTNDRIGVPNDNEYLNTQPEQVALEVNTLAKSEKEIRSSWWKEKEEKSRPCTLMSLPKLVWDSLANRSGMAQLSIQFSESLTTCRSVLPYHRQIRLGTEQNHKDCS